MDLKKSSPFSFPLLSHVLFCVNCLPSLSVRDAFHSPMEILYNRFGKVKYNPLEDLFNNNTHGEQTCMTFMMSLGIYQEICD